MLKERYILALVLTVAEMTVGCVTSSGASTSIYPEMRKPIPTSTPLPAKHKFAGSEPGWLTNIPAK